MPFTIGGDWVPGEEDGGKSKQKTRPVKVRKEKRGKSLVTVVLNLLKSEEELKDIATQLKKKCGCGGTVKDGVIEIQGNNIDLVRQELRKIGIKAQ